MVGDAQGEYYGESAGSFMVQEFKYVDIADVTFWRFFASFTGNVSRRGCQRTVFN
jgi:hypothetical protein